MIKFIKKWWTEVLFVIGAIIYLAGLVSEKDWYNLAMMIMLYLIIGAQTVSTYYHDKVDEHQKEYIKLLENIKEHQTEYIKSLEKFISEL